MTRPLVPHDGGVYLQLFAPLVAALAIQRPSISAVLLAIAVAAAFFGSEALLVLRGGRGFRRRDLDGERAGKRARWLGTIVLVSAVCGLVLAPVAAVELTGLVALPATVALVLASTGRLHTRIGEVLLAIILTGVAAPIAAASGVGRGDALLLWLAWSVGFVTTVLAIRGVIRRQRDPEVDVRRDLHVATVGVLVALAISSRFAAIAVPLALAAAAITFLQISSRRLTLVGVVVGCAAAVSALVELVAFA